MLKYKPKRYAKVAKTVEIILFSLLVVLAVITAFQTSYKVIGQVLVFVISVAMLYIAARYMIYEYTYAVSSDKFEVVRVAGRVPNTLISIDIEASDLLVRIESKKDLKKHSVVRTENVCANLSPRTRLYAYITTVNGKRTAILIEADELFALAVAERINMKKFSQKEDDNSDTED